MKSVIDLLSQEVVLFQGIPVGFNCARMVRRNLRIVVLANWGIYQYEGSIKTMVYDPSSTPLRMFVKDHLEVSLLDRSVEE